MKPYSITAAVIFARGVACLSLALAVMIVARYPLGGHWLAAAAIVYALLLLRWPWLWLIVLPAALSGLDLSPWSGSFLADEFDVLLLATLAVHYGRMRPQQGASETSRLGHIALSAMALSYMASLAVALRGFPAIDLNAFSTYWSPYYALRVAKGFVWALALAPLIAREFREPAKASHRLALGIQVGLLIVGLWVIWERLVFTGLFDFSKSFRVTGPFFTMHVGGQHVDAYLAMALPFAFIPLAGRRPWLSVLWSCVLLTLGVYAVMVTMSRGVIVAAPLAVLLVAADRLRRIRSFHINPGRLLLWTAGVTLVLIIAALPLMQSRFLQGRFGRWRADLDGRWNHWVHAVNIMPAGPMHTLFGAGLGSYPRIATEDAYGPDRAGQYEYRQEDGNRYLRFHRGGHNIYFGQQVGIRPYETYRLLVDLRSPHEGAGVNFTLYEKNLLYSFRGFTVRVEVNENNGQWESHSLLIHTQDTGQPGAWGLRRPVRFGMFRSVKEGWVDVDNVRLLDSAGRNLLSNGGFSRVNDRWFITCDHHTTWRVFNLWVRLYFEQGVVGIAAFILYLSFVLTSLWRCWRSGHPLAPVLAASLAGFLLVGLFGSLLDAPRIALLFFTLTMVPGLSAQLPTPNSQLPTPNSP